MNENQNICAVILAGGHGTRLWPLSRSKRPKQFLSIYSEDETMLQSTVKRLSGLNVNSNITVCNEDHRFFVADQLKEINKLDTILLEPFSKNTAPAIALAAMLNNKDSLLLVMAADHVIKNQDMFINAINKAVPLAAEGRLVTFGIKPKMPHTGYGYIKKGKKFQNGFKVEEFTEKPNKKDAESYLLSGNYVWNSGIFLMKASTYLEELKKYNNKIYEISYKCINEITSDLDFKRIDPELFKDCPDISIDYAVMEKTDKAYVVDMDADWSDIGSWNSMWDIAEDKDSFNNKLVGDIFSIDTTNSYIRSEDKMVASIGVSNLIIIETKDTVLIMDREKSENIKDLIKILKDNSRPEWELAREVFRPWGKYDSLHNGEKHQVKIITVKPGAKLSIQKHQKRAEHWIVISGTAKVTKGKETFILNENESTYIQIGEVHSLENPGDVDLEIIEVQTGTYFGEDDIIRLDDIYGRS